MPLPGTIWDGLDSEYIGKDGRRSFVGTCAVCLTSYRAGDMIVWSSNAECQDVFHESCFMTWAKRKGNPSCPCCRLRFVKQELSDHILPSVIELNEDEVDFGSSE